MNRESSEAVIKAFHAVFNNESPDIFSQPQEFVVIDRFKMIIQFLGVAGDFQGTEMEEHWQSIVELAAELRVYFLSITSEERGELVKKAMDMGNPFEKKTEETKPESAESPKTVKGFDKSTQRAGAFAGNAGLNDESTMENAMPHPEVSTGVRGAFYQNVQRETIDYSIWSTPLIDILRPFWEPLVFKSRFGSIWNKGLLWTAYPAIIVPYLFNAAYFLWHWHFKEEFHIYTRVLLESMTQNNVGRYWLGVWTYRFALEATFLTNWEHWWDETNKESAYLLGDRWFRDVPPNINKMTVLNREIKDFGEYIQNPKVNSYLRSRTAGLGGLHVYFEDNQSPSAARAIQNEISGTLSPIDQSVMYILYDGFFDDKYLNVAMPVALFTAMFLSMLWWQYYFPNLILDYADLHSLNYMQKWATDIEKTLEFLKDNVAVHGRALGGRQFLEQFPRRMRRVRAKFTRAHEEIKEWQQRPFTLYRTPLYDACDHLSEAVEELKALEDENGGRYEHDVLDALLKLNEQKKQFQRAKGEALRHCDVLDEPLIAQYGEPMHNGNDNPNTHMFINNMVVEVDTKVQEAMARALRNYRNMAGPPPTVAEVDRYAYIVSQARTFLSKVMDAEEPRAHQAQGQALVPRNRHQFVGFNDANNNWRRILRNWSNGALNAPWDPNVNVQASAAHGHLDSEQVLVSTPRSHLMVDSVFEAFKACKASVP